MTDSPAAGTASLTFIGTATTVLRIGPFTVLTDPNFLRRGQRAYLGYGLFSKRTTEPAAQPDDLPALDAVLLSHLHGDHFDRVARDSLPRDLPVVTTAHAGERLSRWGFTHTVPLDTWQSHELTREDDRLRVTSVPGRHGPGIVDRLLPPVMGSIVEWERPEGRRLRLYVTGDTIFRRELHEVARRFPVLDAMVIHLGGTRILRIWLTMDASQGANLVELAAPALTVPIHYDDYTVFRSPLTHFVDEWRRRDLPGKLRTVMRGETVNLGVGTAVR